jgi:hypothetical protein
MALQHRGIGAEPERLSNRPVPDVRLVTGAIALWVAGAARRIANMPPACIPSIVTEPASYEMHHRVLPVQG